MRQRRVEPSTAKQDGYRIEKYLIPQWGDVRLNRIRRADIQEWVNELLDEDGDYALSPSTVDRIFRLLSASMKTAVLGNKIPGNPCFGVKIAAAVPGHERYLTRAEFDLIAHHLNEPYRTMAILLVGTGMRFGEMAGLHWSRVDFGNGFITVAETWDGTAQRIKATTKSGKTRRVPIPSWVQDALIARPRTLAPTCGLPHAKGGVRCTSPLVMLSPTGKPLDVTQVGRLQWRQAVELSGVGHVRMHDLRHTYASWLRQDGADIEHVQELLGHATILTTQRYSHFGPERFETARRILDGKASAAGAPIPPHDLENGETTRSA